MIKKSIKTNSYIFIGCLLSACAQAQIVPDAGSILREQQRPALDLPTRRPPPVTLDEPARPTAKPSASAAELRFVLQRFVISGNTVFSQLTLQALVQDYIGKEVGFAELDVAAARISRYYRERGYMVARAYLPAQDIKDGSVEIAVLEGRFGKVEINNTSHVRDSVVRAHTARLPGEVVYELRLERQLLLLNDLAGVGEARASLRPGAAVGESDLVVEVTPAPRASGSIELDNHGNRFTGAAHLTARLNLLSPLGLGDTFNALFTKGFNGLEYGRVGYLLPLGGDGLKLGTAYSSTHYRLGKSFAALDASGMAENYTLNASYPFVRTRNFNLYGQAAYDWREFQDRQGSTVTVADKTTRVATLSLSGDARDALLLGGITVFSVGYGGGRTNIETPAARAIDDASARVQGRFEKLNLSLLRLQSLSDQISTYLSFSAQKAQKNLDSSEKFLLGGANGVRSYPQGEASGDSGYLATAELRYTLNAAAVPGVLQPFAFVDAGGVTINEKPFAATTNKRTLAGGGIGLSWARANDFQVKLTVATRIGNERVVSDTDERTRGWLQAIKYF